MTSILSYWNSTATDCLITSVNGSLREPMFVLNSFLCLCFSSCACRSFVAFQALCIAKNIKLGTVLHVGPTRFTPEQLNEELVGNNINVKFVCAYLVVDAVASKIGPFKNSVTTKDCISSKDPTQGYFYWWLMLHFFIQGVCKKKMTVPGLSLSRPGGEASECDKMRMDANRMLATFALRLGNHTPDLAQLYFQPCSKPLPESQEEEQDEGDDDGKSSSDSDGEERGGSGDEAPTQRGQENNDDANEEDE